MNKSGFLFLFLSVFCPPPSPLFIGSLLSSWFMAALCSLADSTPLSLGSLVSDQLARVIVYQTGAETPYLRFDTVNKLSHVSKPSSDFTSPKKTGLIGWIKITSDFSSDLKRPGGQMKMCVTSSLEGRSFIPLSPTNPNSITQLSTSWSTCRQITLFVNVSFCREGDFAR